MPEDDIYYEQVPDEVYAIGEDPEEEVEDADSQEESTIAQLTFERRLIAVQRKLKAPKSQFNSFSKFYYRNCEDILEGLKPLLEEYDLLLVVNNDIVYIQGFFYVKATATVYDPDSEKSVSAVAYAREPSSKKGMDDSQVTGTASSYANKRALGNLFAIDDNKDADADEPEQKPRQQKPQQQKQPQQPSGILAHCESCGTRYMFETQQQYQQFLMAPNCCANPRWVVE